VSPIFPEPPTGTSSDISHVIVIPAFNEMETLPLLLADIGRMLSQTTAIIIVDDSAHELARETEQRCRRSLGKEFPNLWFILNNSKSGRGAAVITGLQWGIRVFPLAQWFVECDADGSHRPADICELLYNDDTDAVLVGSRYLADSEKKGWSRQRRLMSRALNFSIPRILGIPLTDITNGLRRYRRDATIALVNHRYTSTTFICLSEQAAVLRGQGYRLGEIPIVFEERRAADSSVGFAELWASLVGLIKLVRRRHHFGR
jgi:dolichol-phosphate mannosyltransferase